MSSYSKLNNSWTRNSSLSSSAFNPFKSLPIPDPNSNVENYYNTLIGTYAPPTNITPNNSPYPMYYNQPVKNGKLVNNSVWQTQNMYNCS